MNSNEYGIPAEVEAFLAAVPLFQMLEFSCFPERRITAEEWLADQEEMLSADPSSTSLRALTDLPTGEMLVIDLDSADEGFPLTIAELGFPEDAEPLDLTLSEYVALAVELASYERQMFAGHYRFDEIKAAMTSRGLQQNSYWSEWLGYLDESREETEERMCDIREGRV